MDFRTQIEIKKSDIDIDYDSNILFIGSCFSNNIGLILKDNKFNTLINPFGVVYNPISIYNSLNFLISNKLFTDKDLFFDGNLYNSFYHHSSFSNTNKENCLNHINTNINKAHKYLQQTNFLFITFGTSWVYEHFETNKIVSNCHKLPAKEFKRYRLTVAEITTLYNKLIQKLKTINPTLKIIFTVSPIRHWKDGAHQNQLSKATLHLAIDEIINSTNNCFYFPSYEIIMDDLRDYRFYASDMLHINEIGVNYIWEKFSDTYFTDKTKNYKNQINKIIAAKNHKPFNPKSIEYQKFAQNQLNKISELSKLELNIDFSNEIDFFTNIIK